mmetsp:Transcript_6722/g.7719  ORF Transcript_6722/g.7719 Transcript_6722/m.7719 type:complete len:329 (-) Transcript_6722:33-1019(-)
MASPPHITATLTQIDVHDYDGYFYPYFSMHIFDPNTSTIYVYVGLEGERAPKDTTEIVFHPSVKIIKEWAFEYCTKLRRVIMNENVEVIEHHAFYECRSLDAMFLPSSIKRIGDGSFFGCTNLRILSIPQTIDVQNIGRSIMYRCDTFWHMHSAHLLQSDENLNQVNQAIIAFNHNLPPLHKVCLDANVTAQSISQCVETHGIAAAYNTDYGDGMTPMHILALNPHADASSIMACFEANMGAVLEPYSEGRNNEYPSALSGKTPLDYLAEYNVESHLDIVAALCMHREAHQSTKSYMLEQHVRSNATKNGNNTDDHDNTSSSKRQKIT